MTRDFTDQEIEILEAKGFVRMGRFFFLEDDEARRTTKILLVPALGGGFVFKLEVEQICYEGDGQTYEDQSCIFSQPDQTLSSFLILHL